MNFTEPQMPSSNETDLDTPIWGARNIAVAAGVLDEQGKPNMRRVYYLLEKQYLPASKVGRVYTSTPRRLRAIANGG
jgi:hypothetical protein